MQKIAVLLRTHALPALLRGRQINAAIVWGGAVWNVLGDGMLPADVRDARIGGFARFA